MNITLEAIFTIGIAVLLLAAFLPLAFRMVPMNHVYGFRTSESFKSQEHWYEINARGGRIVVCSLLPVLLVGIAKLFVPATAFFYLNICAAAFPVIICWILFRRQNSKCAKADETLKSSSMVNQ